MSTYRIGPYCYSDELYHHGVKGQKWGERNYQYEDGSLTPAGRDHYGLKDQLRNRRNGYSPVLSGRDPHGFKDQLKNRHDRDGEKRTLGQKIVGHLENRGRKLDAKSGGHGYRKAIFGALGRNFAASAGLTAVNLLTKGEYDTQVKIGAGVIGSINNLMLTRDLASVYTSRRTSGR